MIFSEKQVEGEKKIFSFSRQHLFQTIHLIYASAFQKKKKITHYTWLILSPQPGLVHPTTEHPMGN